MPERHSKASTFRQQANPCGRERAPFDVAGRINDLINCYLIYFGQVLQANLPQIILALIALVIMLFAAYIFLKG